MDNFVTDRRKPKSHYKRSAKFLNSSLPGFFRIHFRSQLFAGEQ